jgi:hypothetical protein
MLRRARFSLTHLRSGNESRLFDLTAQLKVPAVTRAAAMPLLSPQSDLPKSGMSRRTLLKAGVAGSAALGLGRWLYTAATPRAAPLAVLDASARPILAAIVPVLLDGALPLGAAATAAYAETLAGVEQTIAGLPPATREELAELFSLLDFAPTRCLVAGVWSPWPQASREAIAAFLTRWRDSRFALLRSAYGALHQIVLASWYANPRSWPAIGYAGPPALSTE